MQSTNIPHIKAALWEQAFIGGTQVRWDRSWPSGNEKASSKRWFADGGGGPVSNM